MAEIKNKRWQPLTLPSGHVVPAGGALTTDNEILRQIDNARVFPALIGVGDIEVTYDPDPEPTGTRATVSIEAPPEPIPEAVPVEAEAPAEVAAESRKK